MKGLNLVSETNHTELALDKSNIDVKAGGPSINERMAYNADIYKARFLTSSVLLSLVLSPVLYSLYEQRIVFYFPIILILLYIMIGIVRHVIAKRKLERSRERDLKATYGETKSVVKRHK